MPRKASSNPSKYKGVNHKKGTKKPWQATRSYKSLQPDGSHKWFNGKPSKKLPTGSSKAYIGTYATEEEAAYAADRLYRQLVEQGLVQWKYKSINFPTEEEKQRQHSMKPGKVVVDGVKTFVKTSEYKFMFWDQAREKYVGEIKPLGICTNDVDEEQCRLKLLKICEERGVDPETGKLLDASVKIEKSSKIELARPCINKVGEIPRKAVGVTPKKKKKGKPVFGTKRSRGSKRKAGNPKREPKRLKREDSPWLPPEEIFSRAIIDDREQIEKPTCKAHLEEISLEINESNRLSQEVPLDLGTRDDAVFAPSPPLTQDDTAPEALSQRSTCEANIPFLFEGMLSQTPVEDCSDNEPPKPWRQTGSPFALPIKESLQPFEDFWEGEMIDDMNTSLNL